MSRSCPGFLDRYGIWNNGFDCSSPRVCCGTETDRYCCLPSSKLPSFPTSTPALSTYQSFDDLDSYTTHTSDSLLSEKWFFIRMCTTGLLFAILLLVFIVVYLCATSIRHMRRQRKTPIVQMPQPPTSPMFIQPKRLPSNRVSMISHASSDVKSTYTETSMVAPTSLNLYPTANNRNSTVSASSSYYIYPNELEYLCK